MIYQILADLKKHNTFFVLPSFRPGRILQHLKRHVEVRTSTLATEFGVAIMTVWCDLALPAEQGLLVKVPGSDEKHLGPLEAAAGQKRLHFLRGSSSSKRRQVRYLGSTATFCERIFYA
jgi:hypothetical protein